MYVSLFVCLFVRTYYTFCRCAICNVWVKHYVKPRISTKGFTRTENTVYTQLTQHYLIEYVLFRIYLISVLITHYT